MIVNIYKERGKTKRVGEERRRVLTPYKNYTS
jgi:hypothetical protein